MAVINLTDNNFDMEVLNSAQPVLVDFWASWCGPCMMVSPLVEQLAMEHPEYKFCKVNVDEQPLLANRFHIMYIPSLLVFKNGILKNQSNGAIPKDKILELFNV